MNAPPRNGPACRVQHPGMEGRAESRARNPAEQGKLCFLRLWCSRRHDHWLARKIDFLVRVTRRVPEVPRFFHCRSTVRGAGVKAPRRTRGNPSRARLHTTCSKPHLAAQAFGTERRYCGASNRGKHQGATVGRPARPSGTRKLFRNGSQCPRARERQVPCGAGPRFFGWEGQPRR